METAAPKVFLAASYCCLGNVVLFGGWGGLMDLFSRRLVLTCPCTYMSFVGEHSHKYKHIANTANRFLFKSVGSH